MMPIYFDHNATTPLDPRVRSEMLPWLGGELHGNPSSVHSFGQSARAAVEQARSQVAALIEVRPVEVVFTASGTEANNAVMFSCAREAGLRGHLVISAIEHPSVCVAANELEKAGMRVTRVLPGPQGRVEAGSMVDAIQDDTVLVCLMLANNELGTLQPVAEVAAECRSRGVAILCDAVQAVGKISVRPEQLGVDYLTLGAHKFYGPLGAAALWVRKGVALEALLVGGGQERNRRSSTENVPAVVGMGVASQLAAQELEQRGAKLAELRDLFESGIGRLGGAAIHGLEVPRLPNTSHFELEGTDAESLMIRLDMAGFAVSTGSACASGAVEASPTLQAIGLSKRQALSCLRVSFGLGNSSQEVDLFLSTLASQVAALRELSSATR